MDPNQIIKSQICETHPVTRYVNMDSAKPGLVLRRISRLLQKFPHDLRRSVFEVKRLSFVLISSSLVKQMVSIKFYPWPACRCPWFEILRIRNSDIWCRSIKLKRSPWPFTIHVSPLEKGNSCVQITTILQCFPFLINCPEGYTYKRRTKNIDF